MSWIRDKMRKDIQDNLVDLVELEAIVTIDVVTPILKNINQEITINPVEKTRKSDKLLATKKK